VEGDGFEPSVPRLRRNSARLAARDATRVRNTIVRVDQLEREEAGRSHRLQAASTSSASIDSPEHGAVCHSLAQPARDIARMVARRAQEGLLALALFDPDDLRSLSISVSLSDTTSEARRPVA